MRTLSDPHFMSSFPIKIGLLSFGFASVMGFVFSNPTGENVTAGSASFDRSGNTLTILQSTDKLITNWQDFSIQSNELTKFIQPSSSSASLNRVISGNPSSILGNLEANGKVYLINPNGIVVGSGANINCNSFIASTLDLKDNEFLAGGEMTFSGNSTASIMNLGKITASGGNVFLMARQVQNQGEIHADQGNVGLGAGTEILLQESGNERMYVKAGEVTNGTGVDQQGVISAIRTELKSAGSVYTLAINAGGRIDATQVEKIGGEVYLRAPGGKIKQTGTIDARGAAQGGKVVMEASQIAVGGAVDVSSGEKGGTIYVGGGFQGNDSTIQNAQQVKIVTGALLKANGGNGNVVVWSDGTTEFYGSLQATGANAEISGKNNLIYDGQLDLGGIGKLLLDPQTLDINSAGVGTNRTLAADLDQFTDFPAETSYMTPTQLLTLLSAANVTLQANTDITFSSSLDASASMYLNKNLTVNAGRRVTLNSNVAVTLNGGSFIATINDSGAQAAQRTAGDAFFQMSGGSSITTNGGNVSVNVGNYGASTSGGIVIGNGATTSTISSGNGSISLTGYGNASNNFGVFLNKGTVQSSGGDISLTGTGYSGTSSSFTYGTLIQASSSVSSVNGNITIRGTSQATGNNEAGLTMASGAQILATGTGNINLIGSGSATAGTVAGTGNGSYGLYLVDSGGSNTKISAVNGNITMNGTAGAGISSGVEFANDFRINSSGSGVISLTGTGNSSGIGINATGVGQITSTGSGAITLEGNSGSGNASFTYGTIFQSGFRLSTVDGNITVNGTSAATNTFEAGVVVASAAQILSTGAGTITLNGTGSSSGTTGNYGIWMVGGTTKISSVSGAIGLNGTGRGSGGGNNGMVIQSTSTVASTGSATITLSGSGAGTAAGIVTTVGSNVIGGASATGDITLISNTATAGNDSISLANLNIQTSGKVNLQPLNNSTTIGVNTGATGDFNLSSTDLATIQSGNSGIYIGKSTGTGAVDLRATTWTDGVTVLNTGTGASGITVNGAQTASANKNIVLATTGTFSNAVGAGALSVSGTGKWLIYVPTAAGSGITVNGATPSATLNGLSSKYLYNGTYATLAPGSITQTGNRYVFGTAATLTFQANNAEKFYGDVNPAFTSTFVSGLLGSDTLANAFQGTLGATSTASTPLSPIQLNLGSGASDLNYKFNFVDGTLKTIFDVTKSPELNKVIDSNSGKLVEGIVKDVFPQNKLNLIGSNKLELAELQKGGVEVFLGEDSKEEKLEANQIFKRWLQWIQGSR